MKKKLCKIDKPYFKKHKDEILEVIVEPKYICKDCFRASNQNKILCEPIKIREK